jgi:hypothetical protein
LIPGQRSEPAKLKSILKIQYSLPEKTWQQSYLARKTIRPCFETTMSKQPETLLVAYQAMKRQKKATRRVLTVPQNFYRKPGFEYRELIETQASIVCSSTSRNLLALKQLEGHQEWTLAQRLRGLGKRLPLAVFWRFELPVS